MGRRHLLEWILAVALAAGSGPARAQDVGEIALIADTTGDIQRGIATPNVYLERAACAFFQSHPDRFDAIFVFTSIPLNLLTRTQQGFPVKRAALGIGRDNGFDFSARFCTTRLRQAVKMSDIDVFDADPDGRYTGILLFPLTGIQLMGHEFGHQWMASIKFQRTDGIDHCAVRGYEPTGDPMPGSCDGYPETDFNQHWSYYFNSGSLMYGSQIQDLGGGQFRLTNPSPKFGELDQYLMGLRDPSEVSPMFLVDVGDLAGAGSASLPLNASGSDTVSGARVDFTIDDVIRANGPRVPARETCHWKAAFLLVYDPQAPPTAAQIAKVDTYRRRWEVFYADATDRRGSFDTTLSGSGTGTAECQGPAAPPTDAGALDAAPTDATSLDATLPDAVSTTPDLGPTGDTGEADGSSSQDDAGARLDAASGADAPVLTGGDARASDGEGAQVIKTGDGCSCRAATPGPSRDRAKAFAGLLVFAWIARFRRRATLGPRRDYGRHATV
ncbi:MAG: hypothetical protein IT384_13255 [Deltaproteobacteria bacterium]|nr:hypothetical protein [Deltaproteobacteria bacterium]